MSKGCQNVMGSSDESDCNIVVCWDKGMVILHGVFSYWVIGVTIGREKGDTRKKKGEKKGEEEEEEDRTSVFHRSRLHMIYIA